MSIATDLRKAAVTWPMPELSEVGFAQLNAFSEFGELILRNETQIRIFMLFIACALDGGPRVPMTNQELSDLHYKVGKPSALDFFRTAVGIETHHGIRSKP